MNLKTKKSKIGIFVSLATAAFGTAVGFFLRKKSKKAKGPNYAAGL